MMAKRQNGKGTLRKRKDGRWEGRFNAGVDDNGKKKVKYVLAKTRSECAVRLKALQPHLLKAFHQKPSALVIRIPHLCHIFIAVL